MSQSLVGNVFERKPGAFPAPPKGSPLKGGFPATQHRSKSVFARGLERGPAKAQEKRDELPHVIPSQKPEPSRVSNSLDDDWRSQMSKENERHVEEMTEEQREQERQDIMERFGPGVGDLLKRIRDARTQQDNLVSKGSTDPGLEAVPFAPRPQPAMHSVKRTSPPPALSTSSSRPSSRSDRKLRFAELSPQDVYVYESAPSSPKRTALALPPPTGDDSAISLGPWKGSMKSEIVPTQAPDTKEPEEGTPEYIRRRYFPNAPSNDPNLAWMELAPTGSSDQSPTAQRFDLMGAPVSPSLSTSLPTHLGLHHHAEGTHAGYTLEDIFLLTRSTVPAQRATMLNVLGRITKRLSRMAGGENVGMPEFQGKEEQTRKRILAAGIEAISERGSVGARAIEVVWECIAGWREDLNDAIEGIELDTPNDAAISSLQLEFFLPQIKTLLSQGDLAPESSTQLLAILHRLARHSNSIASSIVDTSGLIATITQAFLLTTIPSTDTTTSSNPLALDLLIALTKASRSNAERLVDIADSLLRFVAMLPSTSPYPFNIATTLLACTLDFYAALGSYGLYAHIASTAMEQFHQIARFISDNPQTPRKLLTSWLGLLEVWIVCAVDPHKTTPTHEILWSQVVGWGWSEEVLNLRDNLGSSDVDWAVWAAMWRAQAAWLEGSRTNGVRGGEGERRLCVERIKPGFENGREKQVIEDAISAFQQDLLAFDASSNKLKQFHLLASHSETIMAAIRLWVACTPPITDLPLDLPPFVLPFSQLSDLCAKLVTHPLWLCASTSVPSLYPFCLPITNLLSCYLQLSRRLPGITSDLWVAQAFAILPKLLPGDNAFAGHILDVIFKLFNPNWLASQTANAHPELSIWKKGGLRIIEPFLRDTLCPEGGIRVGPSSLTPQAISSTTTQILPAALKGCSLPLHRDWPLSPLDHLLRSATSPVFKLLPASWDADESEIVSASLLFTMISCGVLQRFSLSDFILTSEEAVFGCMKVFMLEHGQPHTDSAEEVFRNKPVGRLMDELLRPYTIASTRIASSTTPVIPQATSANLEQASTRFLGGTPFYQYYTDFVALYDAISFSDPIFARLLLPPTSMRYPVDYRRHLWCDFGHILKTIRTPVDQVISRDVREYFDPIEGDPQVIGAYVQWLLSGQLQGFVHLVALHHVASNIWRDLNYLDWKEDRARKLLKVVVEQGRLEVVKEVVGYRQSAGGGLLFEPDCFGGLDDEAQEARLQDLERWGGKAYVERLRGIFTT